MMTTTETVGFGKATIYTTDGFGCVTKIEVRGGSVEIGPYAQYREALKVRYVPKGARKTRGFVKDYKPYVVVLEGHGHPTPNGMFDNGKRETTNGVTAVQSQYHAFDSRWVNDWEATLRSYLNDNPETQVVFDQTSERE